MLKDQKLQSFDPVIPDTVDKLILGSMPGVASLQANEYYAHPRNAFWKILQSIYGGSIDSYVEKLQLLKDNHLAVWDTLKYCQRPGSLDSNIAAHSTVTNDFEGLLRQHPAIKLIAFNGKASEKWFNKLALPDLQNSASNMENIRFVSLPSSSPAMASLTLEAKTTLWSDKLHRQ